MDWFAPVDIYCERLGPGFWAEPWNAFSNISFVLAALWGWSTAVRLRVLTPAAAIALVMAALVGVGSFLFHTFANHWSEMADVIPIWSFVAYAVLLSIHEFGGRRTAGTLRVAGIAVAALILVFWLTSDDVSSASVAAAAAPGLLNGSEQYLPALIALWAFAVLAIKRVLAVRGWLLGAAAVFTVSLLARTVDMHLCAVLPLGTHFLWHLLNGLMIALVLQALFRQMALNRVAER